MKWFYVSISYRWNGEIKTFRSHIESSTPDDSEGRVWAHIMLLWDGAIFLGSTVSML